MRLCLFLILLIIINKVENYAFNFTTHLESLQLSAASHCSKESLIAWNCKHCNTSKIIDVSYLYNSFWDTAGFVGYDKINNQFVVSYRGTDFSNVENDIIDADFIQTDFRNFPSGSKVDDGFWIAFKSIRDQFAKSLNALTKKYDTKKFYCQAIVWELQCHC